LHVSVLKEEAINLLNLNSGDIVVDATLGSGGHAESIIQKVLPNGRVIGIDQDHEALERSKKRLSQYLDHITFVESNFRSLDSVLSENNISAIDGILIDLGVSQDQILSATRGFSFRSDAPLDMRMSLKSNLTAADLINGYSEEDLANVFWEYGEERKSRYFAKHIVEARRKKPIKTTKDLATFIEKLAPRRGKIHPATKVFQALRIEVNDELGAVHEFLPKALDALNSGKRIAVISFHSLEDRIVKNIFRDKAKENIIRLINKKVIKPSRKETLENPKSRSAKLRIAEKI